MRDTRAMSSTPNASTTGRGPGRGRALGVALWVLQVLLALQFLVAGFLKVGGDPAMVQMFADIGVGQWFRFVVGGLELAGAVGVLVPRLSGLAALGLICLMVGATVTNVAVLGTSPLLPVVLLAVAVLVAWGRRERTATLLRRPNGRRSR